MIHPAHITKQADYSPNGVRRRARIPRILRVRTQNEQADPRRGGIRDGRQDGRPDERPDNRPRPGDRDDRQDNRPDNRQKGNDRKKDEERASREAAAASARLEAGKNATAETVTASKYYNSKNLSPKRRC